MAYGTQTKTKSPLARSHHVAQIVVDCGGCEAFAISGHHRDRQASTFGFRRRLGIELRARCGRQRLGMQVLTDLLHVLRLTIHKYLGEPQPVGEYPQRQSAEEVPLPNVSYKGDRDWQEDQWNEKMVGGIICNPVLTGIPPFEATVDERTWITAGVRMAGEVGLRQYLVNVLYQLKKSVSNMATET